MNIEFQPNDDNTINHTCKSHREGDWIVFTCPHCKEYENRINFKTKERKVKPAIDPEILHNGSFVPPGLDANLYVPN